MGGGFGNSDTPGQGEGGWFENPRFWRTSFVDGPLKDNNHHFGLNLKNKRTNMHTDRCGFE